jgi:hypothetical protein
LLYFFFGNQEQLRSLVLHNEIVFMKIKSTIFLVASIYLVQAQEETSFEPVDETFNTTRVINGHSNETLEKGVLEFRVEHKFGDVAGTNGGVSTFFGLDNSADIRIAFEYGISDRLMIGLGRSKGYGPYRGLLDGFVKYQVLRQTEDNKVPLSMSVLASSTLVYTKALSDPTLVANYPEFAHRMAYASQFIVTRKFGEIGSLALMPTYTHRNYVAFSDQNGLFSMGVGGRIGFLKKFAIIAEYYHNFNQQDLRQEFNNSLAFAFEWVTFGHVFSIYAANAGGFGEQQFIPYTAGKWLEGQYRIGFAITRKFEL